MTDTRERWDLVRTSAGIALLALLCFLAFTYIDRAQKKWLWGDEGLELTYTCPEPRTAMLFNGAKGQCSPNPLYYILQKTIVHVLDPFPMDPLLLWRATSILGGLLCVLLLWFSAQIFLGPWTALLVPIALASQPIVQLYSVESRPYITWVLCFGFAIDAALRFVRRPTFSWLHYGYLASTFLALTLVAGPGFLQAAALLLALFLVFVFGKGFLGAGAVKFWSLRLGPLLALVAIIGLYYSTRSCLGAGDAGPMDLWKTKDPKLVLALIRLWIPKLPPWAWANYLLVALGAYQVFQTLRRPENWQNQSPAKNFLALAIVLQTMVIGVMALLIIREHYFFAQRMFITVTILHAMLLLLGLEWLSQRWAEKQKIWIPLFFLTLVPTISVQGNPAIHIPPPEAPAVDKDLACAFVSGTVLRFPKKTVEYERGPNIYVAIQRLKKTCSEIKGATDPALDGGIDFRDKENVIVPNDASHLADTARLVNHQACDDLLKIESY